MNRRVAVVLGLVVAVIVGAIVLLASGSPEAPPTEVEAEGGDVEVAEGPEPPSETELADIVDADVVRHGPRIVFRAQMADRIPARVKGGAMTWRWDIYENGVSTWIVSASLDIGPTASLTSTQTNFGASTFDDRFPGMMVIDGDTLKITLRPEKIEEDWPDDFEWSLGTMLDGAQGNPRSALATDTAPNEGRGVLED